MKKHLILIRISIVITIFTILFFSCNLASTEDDSGSKKGSSKSSSSDDIIVTETTSTEDAVVEQNQTITEETEKTEVTETTEEIIDNATNSDNNLTNDNQLKTSENDKTNQDIVDQQDSEDNDGEEYVLSEDLSGKNPDYYIIPVNGGNEIAIPDNSTVNLNDYNMGVYVNNKFAGKFKIEAYFTLKGEIEKHEAFHINILNEQGVKIGFINLKNRGYNKIIAYGIVNLTVANQKIVFSWDQNSGKKQENLEKLTVNLDLNYVKIYTKKDKDNNDNGNKKNK